MTDAPPIDLDAILDGADPYLPDDDGAPEQILAVVCRGCDEVVAGYPGADPDTFDVDTTVDLEGTLHARYCQDADCHAKWTDDDEDLDYLVDLDDEP